MTDFTKENSGFGQLDPSNAATPFNVQAFIVEQMIGRISTMKFVKVMSVTPADGGGGRLDVQPMVSQIDGVGNATPHGTIFNLVYLRLQGGTRAVILDPMVGDIGIAVIADTDSSAVKETGQVSTPGSMRRFDLADGVYIGGILNAAATSFVKMSDTGIEITDPVKIELTAPMVVINGVDFSTHTHLSATPGNPTGPPIV